MNSLELAGRIALTVQTLVLFKGSSYCTIPVVFYTLTGQLHFLLQQDFFRENRTQSYIHHKETPSYQRHGWRQVCGEGWLTEYLDLSDGRVVAANLRSW
jgi:hypothetical protein